MKKPMIVGIYVDTRKVKDHLRVFANSESRMKCLYCDDEGWVCTPISHLAVLTPAGVVAPGSPAPNAIQPAPRLPRGFKPDA